MNRRGALAASLAAGLAAVAGVIALERTLALEQQAHAASDRQVAARSAQLDRYEASLRTALARRPPALPPLPKADAAVSGATGAPPPKVVYRRPPPVIVTTHRAGGHEGEHELEVAGAEADD